MESLQSRLKTFSKAKPSKSSSKSNALTWPHPDSFAATPETLADAGFYFNPSLEDPDSVRCFMCDKELSSWDKDDDPFDVHLEKAPKCAWAIARCSLEHDCDADGKFFFKDASRLPTSKAMEKARLDTFGGKKKWWPHDSVKLHGATSKKLAKAGFIYTPQQSGVQDDTATCFYCELALSGWDADDDPVTEHHKREQKSGKACPFFDAKVSKSTLSKSVNGIKKARALPKKAAMDGANDEDKENPPSQAPIAKATKPKAASKSKSKPAESGDTNDAVVVAKPTKPSTRKQSTKQVPVVDEGGEDVEMGVDANISLNNSHHAEIKAADTTPDPPAPAKKKATKKTVTASKDVASEDDRPRGRLQRSTTQKPPSNVDGKIVKHFQDVVVPMDDDSETRKPPKKAAGAKATSRSKSKSRAPSSRPSSRASTKSHTRSKSKTVGIVDQEQLHAPSARAHDTDEDANMKEIDDDAMEVEPPVMPSKAKNKPVKSSRSNPPPEPEPEPYYPLERARSRQNSSIRRDPLQSPSQIPTSVAPDQPTPASLSNPLIVVGAVLQPASEISSQDPEPRPEPEDFDISIPTFTPLLAASPMLPITVLTDEERAMTVEDYIRHQMAQQLEMLRLDGQREIDAFKQHAAEAKARIEAL